MKAPGLFFSSNLNQYLWVGSDECSKCHKLIGVHGVLLWDYWQSTFVERVFCFTCRAEILKSAGKYKEFKQVTLMFLDLLPADALPIWPQRPILASGKGGSVFDVATTPIEGVKTVDKTTLLSRQSIGDSQIGSNVYALLEEKDRSVSFDEGLTLLEDLRTAQPSDERRLLE